MGKSKAIIAITAGKGDTISISTRFEPDITNEMTGEDHPAAQVALQMIGRWRKKAEAEGVIHADED